MLLLKVGTRQIIESYQYIQSTSEMSNVDNPFELGNRE
jgi:hypothetical protein